MHGVMRRAPACVGPRVEPGRLGREAPPRSAAHRRLSTEEVLALVRPPPPSRTGRSTSPQRSPGLQRGELLALRWRDVDFAGSVVRVRASYAAGGLTSPSPARSARSRWHPPSPPHSLGSVNARTGSATMTSSSPGESAATWTAPHCAAATVPRYGAPACGPSAFTTCAHVRYTDDRQGRHPPRPGVDGPRRHPDDDALPALRPAGRGRARSSPRRSRST